MTVPSADTSRVRTILFIIFVRFDSMNRRLLDSPRTNGCELVVEHLELAGGVGGLGGPGRAAIRRGRHGTLTLKTPRDIDCSEQDRGALLTGAERGTERNGAEQIRSLTGFMRG